MSPKRKKNCVTINAKEKELSNVDRLRNMEEFAALGQFLFMFGTGVLGLPDFSLEDLEYELFRPESTFARTIGIALIKTISSQRGLVSDQFEEYARKQYRRRKPSAVRDTFGEEDKPKQFESHEVENQVRILYQLSVWAFSHPERIRDKMSDCDEKEQLTWRMEPCGYDRQQNIYYILDDGRLYCRSKIQDNGSRYATKRKTNKRRRISTAVTEREDESDDSDRLIGQWSCVCVGLSDWLSFSESLKSSKDADEKELCMHLIDNVLPELHAEEERRKRFAMEKQKQRLIEEAVANRKRSGRIDAKLARQREEQEKAEALQREKERQKSRKSEEKRLKDRQIRIAAREERIRQRETRKDTSGDDSRESITRRSSRIKKESKVADEEEEDEWIFDCKCGINGVNYQDGTEFIQCGSCDVWQHLDCQHLPSGYEGDYNCDICQRYEAQQASKTEGSPTSPRVTIKLRLAPQSPVVEKRNLSKNASLDVKEEPTQLASTSNSMNGVHPPELRGNDPMANNAPHSFPQHQQSSIEVK